MIGETCAKVNACDDNGDFDRDSDLDLFVCNDFGAFVEPNRLYENDGAGSFIEIGANVSADLAIFCMGSIQGDYDRDGDLDYYFTNLAHRCRESPTRGSSQQYGH